MKEIRKTEDGVIDNLLRAHMARSDGPQVCPEFDPDLANSYVESRLTEVERSRYEGHLSGCGSCRKTVVALVRMSEADAAAYQPQTVAAIAVAKPGRVARIKNAFGALTFPQWAMAAAAVAILAVSIPLLVSRKAAEPSAQSANEVAQARPAAPANADTAASNLTPPAAAANPNASASQATPVTTVTNQLPPGQDQRRGPQAGVIAQQPAQSAPVAASDIQARADQPAAEKAEAKSAADETTPKPVEREQAAPPAAPPAAQPTQGDLDTISRDEARRAQKEKDPAKMTVLRPGRPDGGQRETEAVIRPEQPVAPPSAPARGRSTGLANSPANSIRQGALSETVRPPRTAERKVNGRKFWLRGDTWTDKDHNPGKDMPVVTVARDSDTYRELVAKHSALKQYFAGFDEKERVIVVYKGIVYKLVPQDGK